MGLLALILAFLTKYVYHRNNVLYRTNLIINPLISKHFSYICIMFELVTKNVPFPKPYPGVTRKPPTVSDKGWDKVGGYTLRDKIDFIPQKGMQERVVACKSNLIFLCGESQMGKAQPYDAKVLTPDGFVRMGDIKVGDVICGSNGGTQRVLRIYEQGEKEVVRFTMRDGSSAESSLDHLWKIDCTVIQGKHISGLYTTSEIVDMFNSRSRRKGSIRNICFPICGPVDFNPKKELKIVPYLLGVSIRDCKEDKFIPEEYFYASKEERAELLCGILNIDEIPQNNSITIDYTTSSKKLADGIRFLVNSLGYNCRVSRTINQYYRLYIKFGGERLLHYLESVENVGKKNCRCLP